MSKKILSLGFGSLLATAVTAMALPTPSTLWELNGDLDTSISTTGTTDPLGAVGGWTPSYELVSGGAGAEVLVVPALNSSQWLFADTDDLPANGGAGAGFVNNYTIVLDIKYASIGGFQSIYQTNASNSNDGDSFVDGSGGVGISGDYAGTIAADTWYRLTIVNNFNDSSAGLPTVDTISYFLDGTLVNEAENLSQDGRWSLYPDSSANGVLLLADESGETGEARLNNVALYDRALSTSEISDLGAANAAIPEPASGMLAGLAALAWIARRRRIRR